MVEKTRITMEHSLDANDIVIAKQSGELLDSIALKVIEHDLPDFLMDVRSLNINNEIELRYAMGNKLSLKYKDLDFNKPKFLQFCMDLLSPFMECGDWFLDYHYILAEEEFVFVDRAKNKIQFLYVPLEGFKNKDEEIISFMKSILNRVSLSDGNDFLVKLYQAFGRGNIVLREIYEMVKEEYLHSSQSPKSHGGENISVSRANYENSPEVNSIQLVHSPAPQPVQPKEVNRPTGSQSMNKPSPKQEEKKVTKEETANKPKKEGFFSGLLGKKDESANPFVSPEKPISTIGGDAETQDVMNALFGNTKPEKPKKEKKTKEEKGKQPKEKPAKEKSSGLFGFLKKDKVEPSAPAPFSMPQAANQQIPPVKQGNPPVNVERPAFNYDYTEVDSEEGSDVTMIMGEEVSRNEAALILLDKSLVGLPDRIHLNFTSERIVIGRRSKDVKQPDVAFDPSYNRVGRMHACIQKEGGSHYLVDLGSANGTILNGEVLIPNKPYPLRNDDVIGFVAAHPIKYKVVLS